MDFRIVDFNERVSRGEVILTISFFALLAYFYLGFDIFKGEIVAPMDLLLQYSGWQESGLHLPLFNAQRSDILDALLPRWIFMKRALLSGHFSLWNSLVAGGQPAFPLISGSYLSPSFFLFCFFEDGLGFTLALWVRLVIAGLGAYFLCRARLGILASLFGGITFMMCGFNTSWLMWPQVATSAWIPWVLWACLRLIECPGVRRMVILTMLVAFLLLGGFPSVAAYGLYLAALFTSWVLVNRAILNKSPFQSLKLSLWLAAGVFLALPLISLQLIPFLEYLGEVDLSWRRAGSIPLNKILLLWHPFREGLPHVEHAGYAGKLTILFIPLALWSAAKDKTWRGPFSPYFWFGALILTLMLIYGKPEPIVNYFYKLPVFDFNQNGRMLSLLGLELALLGAVGFQQLFGRSSTFLARVAIKRSHLILYGMGLILLAVQVLDIARVGRSQNAVVPGETFYPLTPTIRFLKERIRAGQAVLHTSAFLIPGTLTAYGLPDWFAHTHRLKKEKAILENLVAYPWASPTAALFDADQIKMGSPYFEALAVRFVLSESPPILSQSENDTPQKLMPGESLTQRFLLKEEVVAWSVQLLTATYRQITAGCAVRISLLDSSGNKIASKVLSKELIRDNQWATFSFDSEVRLEPGLYDLRVDAIGLPSARPIAIWSLIKKDAYPQGYFLRDGKEQKGDLSFRLMGTNQAAREKWTISSPGGTITVFENKDVPPGAYLLKAKTSFERFNRRDIFWEGLHILEISNSVIRHQVTCKEPCWLVRTARLWPGWKALVNGQERPIKPYLGVLPAVKLDRGENQIEWRYEPESWKWGCRISFTTALFLFILLFVHNLVHRKQSRRS